MTKKTYYISQNPDFDTKNTEIKKIPITIELVTKADFDPEFIETKTPNTNYLFNNARLHAKVTEIKNKITSVADFVKKYKFRYTKNYSHKTFNN